MPFIWSPSLGIELLHPVNTDTTGAETRRWPADRQVVILIPRSKRQSKKFTPQSDTCVKSQNAIITLSQVRLNMCQKVSYTQVRQDSNFGMKIIKTARCTSRGRNASLIPPSLLDYRSRSNIFAQKVSQLTRIRSSLLDQGPNLKPINE